VISTPRQGTAVIAAPFSTGDLRSVLGMYATGVTVITTQGVSEPYGMTANSFTGVSFDPPLVLVCAMSQQQGAAVISRFFASRRRPRGPDAFAEIAHRRLTTGAPIIDGVAAYLDCSLVAEYEAGDHMILIGEVLALGADTAARSPLVYYAGGYRTL